MRPFFSIIIPVFNSSPTLPRLLESIVFQHYRNYELVFVDGASTDDTLTQLADFVRLNHELSVVIDSRPDKGIYDAMNRGVEKASGEWLYFIGGDDLFCDAGVLQSVKAAIETEKPDLIYGNVEGISSKTRYVYDSKAKVLAKGIHHQSVFYKRCIFDELGKYDLSYATAADYDFTLKVFFNEEYQIKYIDRDIACFGEDGFSASNFDYKFFSGHYRLLKRHKALDKLADPAKCLTDSIYCCYYLAGRKNDNAIAWRNLLFYVSRVKRASLAFRAATFLHMLKWTVKRPWMI
ncbi:glycosyltransferase family 2 protein [Mucilaginibacter corticis]|uniref:glycosyltransferase family 2 protein n=1 Tax=Mucilaginibacter corticis TaxID=2597670 RepID=UPI00164295DA|nr:glycosyltransferase family 2 protein [Mucilaginibacter corticis]